MFGYRRGPFIDADGWSIFGPLAGDATARYISQSTGNDLNDGTFASPWQSARKGIESGNLLTQGLPHRILYKAGDEWPSDDYPGEVALSRYGRSDKELFLIASYDASGNVPALTGARPKFNVPAGVAGSLRCSGGLETSGGSNVGIVGLEFACPERDPANGAFLNDASFNPVHVSWLNPVKFFLIEDCKFSHGSHGIIVNCPRSGAVWIRRNIINTNWSGTGGGHGLLLRRMSYVLLEENFIYHNGHCVGATSGAGDPIRDHNCYLDGNNLHDTDEPFRGSDTCGRAEAVGNVISRACSNGIQMRMGGRQADNLFIHNGVQGFIAGKPSVYEYNVALHGIIRGSQDAYGFQVIASAHNSNVRNNILAHHEGTSPSFGIYIGGAVTETSVQYSHPPISAAHLDGNIIYDWGSNAVDNDGTGTIGVATTEIDQGGYSGSSRTLYTYDTSIGGPGTEAHFIAGGLARSARTWPTAYTANAVNNYIRAGFDRAAYTSRPRYNTAPYEE